MHATFVEDGLGSKKHTIRIAFDPDDGVHIVTMGGTHMFALSIPQAQELLAYLGDAIAAAQEPPTP